MPIKKAVKASKKTVKAPKKTVKTAPKKKTVKAPKKTVKAAPRKAGKTAKLSERESNRLRQQRFLENHRDEINEKRRERYAERRDEGYCPRCGAKMRSNKSTLCKDCLERARDYNQR